MPTFYLDSSALAKRYKPEKGSDVIQELFQATDTLITSHLSYLDMVAIARRLYSGRELSRPEFERLLGVIDKDFSSLLQVRPISMEVTTAAAGLSMAHGLEGSDSIQLATALSVQPAAAGQAPQCVLVSSDRRMLSVYHELGGQALDPEDAGANELLGRLRVQ